MNIDYPGFWGTDSLCKFFYLEESNMKKMKRLVAVLLAGIMALAMLTACGGTPSTPGSSEFETKVEQAYMAKLNEAFGTEFNNDAAIKKLAVDYIQEVSGAETLSNTALWKHENPTANTQNQVMVCFDPAQSTGNEYVKFYYEVDKAENITPDATNIATLKLTWDTIQKLAANNGKTIELTALGVGAKTIGGKTYVAIGIGMKV